MKKQLFIIDDDPIYRMIAAAMSKDLLPSVQITECDDGKIGLTKLKELEPSNNEIIVLLDINMPLVDGWDFLEQLQEDDFYQLSDLTIYLVSSSTDKADIIQSKRYTCLSGFYHKPLEIEDLKKMLKLN